MTEERIVGGISCREVLADLSAYVDGDLDDQRRSAIEQHVHACDLCTRFGGVFVTTVEAVRRKLGGGTGGLPSGFVDAFRRARRDPT